MRVEQPLAPASAAELADLLRDASARGQPVVPLGGQTHQHLGYRPPDGALYLATERLDRVAEHIPADMTVTVDAGIPLAALQQQLAAQGQWLPWQPACGQMRRVGGALACGAAGPLRLGYGTPRDWVLGMQVALGDGRLVKSGGKVVKNVAGYDSHKLHLGALGTLGVITRVTFKLFPLPEHSQALLLSCPSGAVALELAERMRRPPLAPVSLLLWNGAAEPAGRWSLLVRYDGSLAAVERQSAAALQEADRVAAAQVASTPAQSAQLTTELGQFATPLAGGLPPDALALRVGVAPARLGAALGLLAAGAPPAARPAELLGYAGVGLAYARWALPADAAALVAALAALRTALAPLGGYAVVEAAPAALHGALDLWGPAPASLPIMRALRQQWDPAGILNPGRYVV